VAAEAMADDPMVSCDFMVVNFFLGNGCVLIADCNKKSILVFYPVQSES
jgi:hypothetical protein